MEHSDSETYKSVSLLGKQIVVIPVLTSTTSVAVLHLDARLSVSRGTARRRLACGDAGRSWQRQSHSAQDLVRSASGSSSVRKQTPTLPPKRSIRSAASVMAKWSSISS